MSSGFCSGTGLSPLCCSAQKTAGGEAGPEPGVPGDGRVRSAPGAEGGAGVGSWRRPDPRRRAEGLVSPPDACAAPHRPPRAGWIKHPNQGEPLRAPPVSRLEPPERKTRLQAERECGRPAESVRASGRTRAWGRGQRSPCGPADVAEGTPL